MLAQEPAVADHRVAVHAGQPRGGPDPVAVGQVFDHSMALSRATRSRIAGSPSARRSGPCRCGSRAAGVLGLAVVAADGQIAVPPLAVVGAIRVLAAEAGPELTLNTWRVHCRAPAGQVLSLKLTRHVSIRKKNLGSREYQGDEAIDGLHNLSPPTWPLPIAQEAGNPAAPRVMAPSGAKPIHTYSSFRRLSWVPFDSAPSARPS